MFLFREYAVCALLALMVTGGLVAVYGAACLLKLVIILCARTFQMRQSRSALLTREAICTATESSAMAD